MISRFHHIALEVLQSTPMYHTWVFNDKELERYTRKVLEDFYNQYQNHNDITKQINEYINAG